MGGRNEPESAQTDEQDGAGGPVLGRTEPGNKTWISYVKHNSDLSYEEHSGQFVFLHIVFLRIFWRETGAKGLRRWGGRGGSSELKDVTRGCK